MQVGCRRGEKVLREAAENKDVAKGGGLVLALPSPGDYAGFRLMVSCMIWSKVVMVLALAS